MLENQKEEALAFCSYPEISQLYITVEGSDTLHLLRVVFFFVNISTLMRKIVCLNLFIYDKVPVRNILR